MQDSSYKPLLKIWRLHMALIRCPECGGSISTEAKSCPHCGFPLNKISYTKTPSVTPPTPKSTAWIKMWKKKVIINKLIWTSIFLLILGFLAFCIIMLNVDERAEYWTNQDGTTTAFYYTKYEWIIMCTISGFISFIFFALWLNVLITYKTKIRKYDGYTILVYIGCKNFLLIENIIQDSTVIGRFMYGQLPNKKLVKVGIAAWDASIKIDVGDEKTF